MAGPNDIETCVLMDGCDAIVAEFVTEPTDADLQAVFDAEPCNYGTFSLVCTVGAGCCSNTKVRHIDVPLSDDVVTCNGKPIECNFECMTCTA